MVRCVLVVCWLVFLLLGFLVISRWLFLVRFVLSLEWLRIFMV